MADNFQPQFGWINDKVLLEESFANMSPSSHQDFKVWGVQDSIDPRWGIRRMMMHEVVKKLLGDFTENYRQQSGDCVSFGMKNAEEHLQAFSIAMGNQLANFVNLYPPYYYGISRIQIGQGRMGRSVGSLGSWACEGVKRFGNLSRKADGVPAYSGRVADTWGYSGVPKEFIPIGQQHLTKTVNKIRTVEEAIKALTNGYPITLASSVGYSFLPDANGFHRYSTNWDHQLCLIGIDEGDSKVPGHGIILNSWGDVHGHLLDFRTNEPLPVGILRVSLDNLQRHLDADDSWAISELDLFESRNLDESFFSGFGTTNTTTVVVDDFSNFPRRV